MSAPERTSGFDELSQWSRDRIESWQLDRLRKVLPRAFEHHPYFRWLWKRAGIQEPELASLEDLQRLPIVRKRDLIRAGRRGLRPADGIVGFSTRGTSGEPLLVWLGPAEEEAYIRPTMRGFHWAGLRPGMTALLMSPVWHRLAACEGHAVARLGAHGAYFWGSMGASYVESFLQTLGSVQPEFVTTTAPFLLSLIRRCDEQRTSVARLFWKTRGIVVVGLPLTPPFRAHLEKRLETAVFERSGTQEGAALDECEEHTGPHAHEDVCYLEVVGSDGRRAPEGQRGTLVVTKLTPGSVFVRYDTEDIASFLPGSCPCGRSLRRLKIYGRPESSVVVGRRAITAYDARLCVDQDPTLVGRNVLLVRDEAAGSQRLTVAIEGTATGEDALRERIREQLGVNEAELLWLGALRIDWGFRQVIDRAETQPRQ